MDRSFPLLYSILGISGVDVPAGGSIGPIRFQFPVARFVTGLLFVPLSGAPVDLGALSLTVTDEDGDSLFGDGYGGGSSAGALALCGGLLLTTMTTAPFPNIQPFPLQRPVAGGDVWRFTLANRSGAPIACDLYLLPGAPVTK